LSGSHGWAGFLLVVIGFAAAGARGDAIVMDPGSGGEAGPQGAIEAAADGDSLLLDEGP
jgi:hypothetical protein